MTSHDIGREASRQPLSGAFAGSRSGSAAQRREDLGFDQLLGDRPGSASGAAPIAVDDDLVEPERPQSDKPFDNPFRRPDGGVFPDELRRQHRRTEESLARYLDRAASAGPDSRKTIPQPPPHDKT